MTDLTSQLLTLTREIKTPLESAYRERFPAIEISSSMSSFMSEASHLDSFLSGTSKLLGSLSNYLNKSSLFDDQSSRIQNLSEKVEDNIKESQIKLEILRKIDVKGECQDAIKDILQQKLLNIIKDFQKVLQKRTKILKNNETKQKYISVLSDLEVARRDVPSFLEIE